MHEEELLYKIEALFPRNGEGASQGFYPYRRLRS
jgi:hypothetical protein